MITFDDLKSARPTKRYADGHQKLLATHLGRVKFTPVGQKENMTHVSPAPQPPPRPSEHARLRLVGKKRRANSHRAQRAVKLAQRLRVEGWIRK